MPIIPRFWNLGMSDNNILIVSETIGIYICLFERKFLVAFCLIFYELSIGVSINGLILIIKT